ncbi:type II toxin-antitoxin system RelE/ParE family toxin [Dehalococcoides mccartyi]|jgi:mRNA interferase RelE/StbE|uniref:type II toxin-antitoxin system RelE family toxin n=1 Tax=Dehalococcoides mccartyi TaxID=61435 RepID=UPI000150C755|nr:type II toxin-antitoxin system RelE/ParE family toxin [Dehalococcoides mccartyi]AHB13808.1 addiction module antitoxin [Dehalococcoides mccartyi GY50]AII58183.1 addiction module antitoxin [Dehalococcoides mccartyi CG1]KSV17611.1 addiction module antitoxin [Dehalococcoides mccartyi]OBW61583.1 MAG: addiction module antitoxin [Dehalococcoides mccartyi]
MYRIDLRRKAQQDLDKLPKKDFEAVIETIKELANTPRPKGIEKLKGSGLWRVRQGDYRIVYNIDDKQSQVIIVRIGNRRDIYRSI